MDWRFGKSFEREFLATKGKKSFIALIFSRLEETSWYTTTHSFE